MTQKNQILYNNKVRGAEMLQTPLYIVIFDNLNDAIYSIIYYNLDTCLNL